MHKNEQICKACLHKNIEYKCRLYLENKIKVKGDDSILLCFSGGLNSIALVNIIKNLKLRYKKHPLFGKVECIHIQQQEKIDNQYIKIFEDFSGMKLNILKAYESFEKEELKSFKTIKLLLEGFKDTANNSDILEIFRDRLIRQFARKNKFNHVFKGNNCENLACQVFKNFSKGKGGNITDQSMYEPQNFGYPLREHLQK